jgi:hypothetical protein
VRQRNRRFEEITAARVFRETLIDNLLACLACGLLGTLLGLFIGLAARMMP